MKKMTLLAAMTCFVLAALTSCPAWSAPTSLEVWIRLNCCSVSGRVEPDQLVTITVYGADGSLKGTAAINSSGGYFGVDFRGGYWPFVQIVPGDTVVVGADGAEYTHTLSRISVRRLDPATGEVAGKVRPRRPVVNVYQDYARLAPGGWDAGWNSRDGLPTNARGAFITTFADLKRLDLITVEYTAGEPETGAFTIYHELTVPGLEAIIGTSIARIYAERGRTFEGRLTSRKGVLKGTSRATTTNTYDDDEGVFDFRGPNNDPVTIRGKDRLDVTGRWSFTAAVRPLSLALDPVADQVVGKAKPGAAAELNIWLMDQYGGTLSEYEVFLVADELGAFSYDVPGDVRPGDVASVRVVDGAGNLFSRYATAPPVP